MQHSNDQERFAKLRLIRSANVGPITYRMLLQRFGTAADALDALPDLARRGGARDIAIATVKEIENEVRQVTAIGARHIFLGEALYPSHLAHIESAPPALCVKGHIPLLDRSAVAMVGARNASAAGCRFARQLSVDLADAGLVVVSGLARGIDTHAHEGALASGTIAVVAGGLDVYYPPENAALQDRIAAQGLVVSEVPAGEQPQARHFPRRNRIIAGLSLGVIVVEAAPRSGSLITARFAVEFNREVMAVPGSPLDPRAQGCNQLIREGATLVQSAEDVLEVLQPLQGARQSEPDGVYTPSLISTDATDMERTRILELLGPTPVSIDELIRQSQLTPASTLTVLLELELAGRLERHAGQRVSLRYS